ncbi:polysaccharide deacetylase family protein [Paenibacillus daejeonensis]|uniref:polysaccharide deacetylase family protein n=1 Tax=Paenibacillus daejeonensis TaxID=135193 RepID=UPI00037489E9|nr:polysaccharide deacetylase family protein [Paenibacillus daejeonensis]
MDIQARRLTKLIGLMLLCIGLTACGQSEPVSVSVNGERIDQLEVVRKKRVLYVPDSFIREKLDVPIQWIDMPPDKSDNYYSNKVIVLMYHDLTEDPNSPDEMYIGDFSNQMRLLKEHQFNVITMEQYTAFMLEGASVPDNAVLLTFDDGYETFYTLAYPLLREYGYTATNFVIVSSIDNQSGRPKMSWDQMREMQEQGFSFQSHSYDSHQYGEVNVKHKKGPLLSNYLYLEREERNESDTEYLRRIKADLKLAEQRLQEELGQGSQVFAFPYGAFNDMLQQTLQELGVPLSFTTRPGSNQPGEPFGFRINAPSVGEALLSHLQAYQIEVPSDAVTDLAATTARVPTLVIDGTISNLQGVKPPQDEQTGLIPLRAFCEAYGIQLTWNARDNLVELKLR